MNRYIQRETVAIFILSKLKQCIDYDDFICMGLLKLRGTHCIYLFMLALNLTLLQL